MGKEHEIGLLDIDVAEARSRLRELGAAYKGRIRYSRIEFMIDGKIGDRHSWARVRTDGKSTVITVKRYRGPSMPMDEDEIRTDDFRKAVRLMCKLARSEVLYFETERHKYALGRAEITLDKWPGIPRFMEIEGPSMGYVRRMYKRLGLKGRYVGNVTAEGVYKVYGLDFRKEMLRNKGKLRRLLG